jgi:hypothetical protein
MELETKGLNYTVSKGQDGPKGPYSTNMHSPKHGGIFNDVPQLFTIVLKKLCFTGFKT